MSQRTNRNTLQDKNLKLAVYVIHENEEWLIPLCEALDQLHVPYQEWFINEGSLSLDDVPPNGIFYNRMSASSHTRSHRYAVELTGPILGTARTGVLEHRGTNITEPIVPSEINKTERPFTLWRNIKHKTKSLPGRRLRPSYLLQF